MEAEFREDKRERDKTINALSKEIQALKITLIGIDGNDGMRSQISGLSADINEIKKSFERYFNDISEIRNNESKYDLIFATKIELRISEEKICQKIIELNESLSLDRKAREKQAEEQKKYNKSLTMTKNMFFLYHWIDIFNSIFPYKDGPINYMEKLSNFLKTYPHTNDLEFSQISLFPQAKVLYPFGLGVQDNSLTLHWGTFYQKKRIFYYDIFSPFNFNSVEYFEDMDMIVLHSTEYGFSIRVYFVSYETLSLDFWEALDGNKQLRHNAKIGKSGKVFENFREPFTTYMEMYSNSEDSILPDLFLKKYPEYSPGDFTEEFLHNYTDISCIKLVDLLDTFQRIKEKESILSINSFSCVRHDQLLDKEVTFYSYSSMF